MNQPPHPTPALSPQTLGAYIGSRVFLWDRPEGRRYGTLKGFDGYRTCYVCPEGLSRFTYEHPIYNKMGFPFGNIRLQLRRVESLCEPEIVAMFRAVGFSSDWSDDSLIRLWADEDIRPRSRFTDYLRARGFDCGGFDSEGTWHPSLIDAGLADELLKSTNNP